ncbi:glycosyltransferase family 2 protein [Clostridium ljungdahlii]|uniref:N-acetylglucosaminyl-diphospho-decaprenol L-rhamnosyltransferase n=2 Tax=Clostridium ljungdahlii TaxID=1538 RepID=D8GMK2_CLOLD|nr:glycosyltransferase family 2 protein [Clostridium ljungdahlii]ADK13612.1 predicted glycosyltransferase [Clostridium ljungdahlii DSM 13528]OAA89230.1 N-acetylglucosaminyl-diphospho-decaprenol L-rhamnosyltransferase [Clostridium ljungdahlii DSM 13528]
MEIEPLVYIIILNYNGYKDTIECVNSLKKINYKNYKIVIVDNNSTDESEKILKEKFNQCIIIQTGKNLGYAGGNNVGIRYAVKNNSDYICILNNDVIVEKCFLEELVKYLYSNHNTAMVGPMICEYSNKRVIQSTGAIVNLYKGSVPSLNSGKMEDVVNQKVIKCDYIGGACILVRKEILDEIGLIPENYFLFFEETEWCLKAKKMGYDIVCYCNAKVNHKGSASINKVSGLSEYFMHRNRVVFEKRNANLIQLICFYVYLFLQTIYKIVLKKQSLNILKYYIDGLLNRVDERYSFVHIGKIMR